MKFVVFPSVLMLVAMISCASPRRVLLDQHLSPTELINRVEARNKDITTLEGSGTISLESTKFAQSATFELALRKPDSLRLELYGPFGIHLGSLSLAADRFLYYDRRQNVVVTGKPDRNHLALTLQVNLAADEIIRAVAGDYPMPRANDSIVMNPPVDDQYVLTWNRDGQIRQYYVDGEHYAITGFRDVEGGLASMVATASRIVLRDNIPLPTIMQVIFPIERRSIALAFDDIEVNTAVSCSVIPPPDVEVIEQ